MRERRRVQSARRRVMVRRRGSMGGGNSVECVFMIRNQTKLTSSGPIVYFCTYIQPERDSDLRSGEIFGTKLSSSQCRNLRRASWEQGGRRYEVWGRNRKGFFCIWLRQAWQEKLSAFSYQLSAEIGKTSHISASPRMAGLKPPCTQAHPLSASFAGRPAARCRKPLRAILSAGERDHGHILLPYPGESRFTAFPPNALNGVNINQKLES